MTLEEMLQMERKRKKKQKYDDEEHRIQCSCVKWFNLKYPKLKGRLFAVPNGGRRDAVTAAKLRAEGVVAGVADLILLKSNRDYGALLIEMKTIKGRQSESQKKWQKTVCFNEEYKYVVCRSFDDFKREVDEYLRNV
jgi:VRR-NUC domain protein